MAKKLTQEEFIEQLRSVHGDRYDYSKVQYVNGDTKIDIICEKHGLFSQVAYRHKKGSGCQRCANIEIMQGRVLSREQVINSFEKVHNGKYSYDKFIYTGNADKSTITCLVHGDFQQSPSKHKAGQGCPKCKGASIAEKLRRPPVDVIYEFNLVHGRRYDYSNVVYHNLDTRVEIICKKHGPFSQTPATHRQGRGCALCRDEKLRLERLHTIEDVLPRIIEKHGDKYSYDKFTYLGSGTKSIITCEEHGDFLQAPEQHLRGQGCPKCASVQQGLSQRLTQYDYIERCTDRHQGVYDYSQVIYLGETKKISVVCSEHGVFTPGAGNHLRGSGCPACGGGSSKAEREIFGIAASYYPDAVNGDRTILRPKELDIYIPSIKLAIEFNGLWCHHDGYKDRNAHFDKWKGCKAQGIRLIQITDYEWENNREKMEKLLLNALGVSNKRKVNARQCEVIKLSSSECKDFYNDNHPQGHASNKENFALKDTKGGVVAIMSFGFSKTSRGKAAGKGVWELSRYATSANVRGGASKLFKAFIRELNPDQVKSFSMNDWFNGDVYDKLGFKGELISPDYRVYHFKNGLKPKSRWQRREIPKRLAEIGSDISFDPATDPRTEWEIEDEVKASRIWDSGKIRWIWTPGSNT